MDARSLHVRASMTLFALLSLLLSVSPPTFARTSAPERAEPDAPYVGELAQAGQFSVDVTVDPDRFRAGDKITYTYNYANLTSQTVTNVTMDVTWTDFKDVQKCQPNPNICELINASTGVQRLGELAEGGGIRVTIPDLAPQGQTGSTGKFSIEIFTKVDIYPKVNSTIVQLASTGKLRQGERPVASDTANASPQGPIFSLIKSLKEGTPKQVYVDDEVEFMLQLTNQAKDQNDLDRPEAIDANNVILEDKLPEGSEFVPLADDPTYASTVPGLQSFEYLQDTGILRWKISKLTKNQVIEIPVTFKKLDVDKGCGSLNNNTLTVTSDEMPLSNQGASHVTVSGQGANIPVVVPLKIETVRATPDKVLLAEGENLDATITIIVRSFDTRQVIDDLQLIYTIQTNAAYIAESADPELSDQDLPPEPDTGGGTLTWNFFMEKATLDGNGNIQPSERVFTLQVHALAQGGPGEANATLIIPQDVPAACINEEVRGGLNIEGPPVPPLIISKEVLGAEDKGGEYWVDAGQLLQYNIVLDNQSDNKIQGLRLQDTLPVNADTSGGLVDFWLFSDLLTETVSTTIPGYLITDTENLLPVRIPRVSNALIWSNLTIEAKTQVTLRYTITVDSEEYIRNCNRIEVLEQPLGTNIRLDPGEVCVKINPQVDLIKNVFKPDGTPLDPKRAFPEEEVRFELTLTNNHNHTLKMGLHDVLGDYQFVRRLTVDGDGGYGATLNPAPNPSLGTPNELRWAMRDLGPGEQLKVAFIAKLPPANEDNSCTRGSYDNRALFLFDSAATPNGISRAEYLVTPVPEIRQSVECLLRQVEYSQSVFEPETALGDLVGYELRIRNRNKAEAIQNITVEHLLPPRFSFESYADQSDAEEPPTEEPPTADQRTKLVWQIDTLEPDQIYRIRFYARAGDIVGPQESWMRAFPVTGDIYPICSGSCAKRTTNGQEINFAISSVEVKALITLEPTFVQRECLKQGTPVNYSLDLISTNKNTEYTDVVVEIRLPLELQYVGVGDGTDEPDSITGGGTGQTTIVTWRDITIEKPAAGQSVRKSFSILSRVREIPEDLIDIEISATSSEGLIPVKENAFDDDALGICNILPDPENGTVGLRKELPFAATGNRIVRGQVTVYRVRLINTNPFTVSVNVVDNLPAHFTFTGEVTSNLGLNLVPTEQISATNPSATTLLWSNLTVPRDSSDDPDKPIGDGILDIAYNVRVETTASLGRYLSIARVASITGAPGSPQLTLDDVDDSLGRVQAQVAATTGGGSDGLIIYLPVIRR